MNIEPHSRDVTTPVAFINILCKAEDSGYHTSFTSPSIEYSIQSNDTSNPCASFSCYCKQQVDCCIKSPCTYAKPTQNVHSKCPYQQNIKYENTPKEKRGLKRTIEGGFVQNDNGINSSTPTSVISKEVQKLNVNDTKSNEASIASNTAFNDDIHPVPIITYPVTPIKKVCRDNCNLSPFNRRKVDFSTHSLTCEKKVVKLQAKQKTSSQKPKLPKLWYKPNQKLDIINLLYKHEMYFSASVGKILSYLSLEDIYTFTLVSSTWSDIFKSVNTEQKYNAFIDNVKSNFENWGQDKWKDYSGRQVKPLRETQGANVANINPRSPARSPRTTRFKKFIKAASLDARNQLCCSKCRNPAKVTVETNGEQWVQCVNCTCGYQFCRLCKSDRHPGKMCIRFDLLNGPSPSKRMKNVCPVSSKKSKKNLKRLLFRDTA